MFTILIILAVLMLIGAIPAWPHSRSWGYGPSGGLGLILLILLILDCPAASDAARRRKRMKRHASREGGPARYNLGQRRCGRLNGDCSRPEGRHMSETHHRNGTLASTLGIAPLVAADSEPGKRLTGSGGGVLGGHGGAGQGHPEGPARECALHRDRAGAQDRRRSWWAARYGKGYLSCRSGSKCRLVGAGHHAYRRRAASASRSAAPRRTSSCSS